MVASSHADRPHRRNLDLIEHLDHRACLIEVNVQTVVDPHLQVVLTDVDGTTSSVRFTAEQAGVIGRIVELFDRRGVREFGQLLAEGARLLNEDDADH
ncbi:hypothetical protein ACFYUV_11280 [Nonomuraea sp. NPDC003560]|uniref:hypothetical protein n=1 Tax=Nonomuraea sp. NPDC003560 TaxID=3364341 RepID=UPI00368B5CCD